MRKKVFCYKKNNNRHFISVFPLTFVLIKSVSYDFIWRNICETVKNVSELINNLLWFPGDVVSALNFIFHTKIGSNPWYSLLPFKIGLWLQREKVSFSLWQEHIYTNKILDF